MSEAQEQMTLVGGDIMSEAQEQAALFVWADLQRCKYPELALMYHVPNGGRRDAREAANLKRQGVKAGVPDICLPVARGGFHGLYIELKAGRNKPTAKQVAWMDALGGQGYKTAVCWGWDAAREAVLEYLGGGNNGEKN